MKSRIWGQKVFHYEDTTFLKCTFFWSYKAYNVGLLRTVLISEKGLNVSFHIFCNNLVLFSLLFLFGHKRPLGRTPIKEMYLSLAALFFVICPF